MLCTICKAQNDNTTRAALCIWVHRDHLDEITNELLEELRKGGELARERLYKLHELIRYVRRRASEENDFMLDIQLNPCMGTQTLTTCALLDSGCTGSTINCSYVQKHQLDTCKAAVSIPVYNADGSCNKVGDITKFVEL